MTTWIAEKRVVFLHLSGRRTEGRIAIAAPVEHDDGCVCLVAFDGLRPGFTSYGDDTLQALLLAAKFLGFHLQDFVSGGGRVLYPPDSEAPEDENTDVLLSAMFGPLLSDPERALPDEPASET